MHILSHMLQNKSPRNATQHPPTPRTGGGSKRKRPSTPMAHGSQPTTISRRTDHRATCTDEEYTKVFHHLPEGWQATNYKGSTVTKRQLEMAQWGAYKDDHNALLFQQTILSTRQQHTHTVTQYDTLLAQSIVDQNDI